MSISSILGIQSSILKYLEYSWHSASWYGTTLCWAVILCTSMECLFHFHFTQSQVSWIWQLLLYWKSAISLTAVMWQTVWPRGNTIIVIIIMIMDTSTNLFTFHHCLFSFCLLFPWIISHLLVSVSPFVYFVHECFTCIILYTKLSVQNAFFWWLVICNLPSMVFWCAFSIRLIFYYF